MEPIEGVVFPETEPGWVGTPTQNDLENEHCALVTKNDIDPEPEVGAA